MIDRLATASCFFNPIVRTGTVGVEHRDRFDVGFDLRSDCRLLGVGANNQSKFPADSAHKTERRWTVVFVDAPTEPFICSLAEADRWGQDADRFSPLHSQKFLHETSCPLRMPGRGVRFAFAQGPVAVSGGDDPKASSGQAPDLRQATWLALLV